MSTRTERFQRRGAEKKDEKTEEPEEIIRFSAEEEAALVEESNTVKKEANDLFAKSSFQDAIITYDKALAACPNYLEYEVAVLKSNVAACHLKLEDWKEAVKAASAALEGLDRLKGIGKENAGKEEGEDTKVEEEEADEEILSAGASKAEDTSDKGKREADIDRIRGKALMRRARARSELGGWSGLQGAEEDYKKLAKMSNLSAADRKIVQRQLVQLPPRTKAAQEKEMGEMMEKLKELGNGILKPFGLSTNNFQMQKDPTTGGYSMNFNQGGSPASQ
ncbi:related to tetratricopeptide repeat protein 1 (TTC1) [Rhynchosporium agropyri]|uniref:Related to tetratricopeptide repeat protein 1 (TTC1) n=1 Tax=Rhynchosporium agropyri TaxID=914238 RepID=A0A1E1JTC1_9HELO|nr:related to tetratricopeptide repeat protein 1 (TTC1) [Rhynchosporium agropyri]